MQYSQTAAVRPRASNFVVPSFFDVFIRLDFSGAPNGQYEGNDFFLDNIIVSEVPEPASLLLVGGGLLAAASAARRRRMSRPRG